MFAQAQKSGKYQGSLDVKEREGVYVQLFCQVWTTTCCFYMFLHIIQPEHVASTYHVELTIQSLGFF